MALSASRTFPVFYCGAPCRSLCSTVLKGVSYLSSKIIMLLLEQKSLLIPVCSVLYSSVRKYTRRWRSSVPSCSKERAKYPSVPACAGKDVCAQRQLCLELNCFPCFLALQEQQCILKRSLQLEPRLIYTESQ